MTYEPGPQQGTLHHILFHFILFSHQLTAGRLHNWVKVEANLYGADCQFFSGGSPSRYKATPFRKVAHNIEQKQAIVSVYMSQSRRLFIDISRISIIVLCKLVCHLVRCRFPQCVKNHRLYVEAAVTKTLPCLHRSCVHEFRLRYTLSINANTQSKPRYFSMPAGSPCQQLLMFILY